MSFHHPRYWMSLNTTKNTEKKYDKDCQNDSYENFKYCNPFANLKIMLNRNQITLVIQMRIIFLMIMWMVMRTLFGHILQLSRTTIWRNIR